MCIECYSNGSIMMEDVYVNTEVVDIIQHNALFGVSN